MPRSLSSSSSGFPVQRETPPATRLRRRRWRRPRTAGRRSIRYVIGVPFTRRGSAACHTSDPVAASIARSARSPPPPITRPPAVASTPGAPATPSAGGSATPLQRRMAAQRRRVAERHAPLDRAAVQIDRDEMTVRRLEQRQAVHELGVGVADPRELGVHFRRARVRRQTCPASQTRRCSPGSWS